MGTRNDKQSIVNNVYFHNNLTLSPSAFGYYLKDVPFPIDKTTLIEFALAKEAPKNILHTLNQFSDRQYRNVIDLFKEFWLIN